MMIELSDLSVSYGDEENRVNALRNINLAVNEGEFVTISGKSGCGKTTLLNVLGGIIRPDHGSYLFAGENVNAFTDRRMAEFRNCKIGFIVQHFALINDLTAFENIVLPLKYRKPRAAVSETDIDSLMEKLGIRDKKLRYPYEMSGGEQQRTAICRCLAADTDVILADEPTGALDEETGKAIIEILRELNRKGKTIIMVTHDTELAKAGTRRIFMKDGIITGDYLM